MKHVLIYICLSVSTISVQAQSPDTLQATVPQIQDSIFTEVDQYAEFPGGDKAWSSYLVNTLDPMVPAMNGAKKGKYSVVIKFVINQDGSLQDAVAETKFGYGMEAEAMRVITDGPKWIPAIYKGKKVRSYRRQPITFYMN